ncbi:hypothetical protein Taro_049909 [Colocasia esculenta]|uniref:Uncharacterized protein n=1 Tax=Colocasia esculenta TaxID=4460 RepID=A0A843XCB4_COLES|nr:hypothetical protein [Colocasia esculenta]
MGVGGDPAALLLGCCRLCSSSSFTSGWRCSISLLLSWGLLLVLAGQALGGDPYVYYEWEVAYISASPLLVKQQHKIHRTVQIDRAAFSMGISLRDFFMKVVPHNFLYELQLESQQMKISA